MFDLSWGEIALVGAVALIVIGPKELPGVLRGVGQAVAKLRRMASDFQYQFNQALQEAEVDKVKS
ncbi:Sec-independent protein translocase protein TatB, partial [Citrobacter koseri]|uniref:Sec-independent protein translocase protein TatB n=1 Tax=Citrobacter koseri TaxID=545 RepID=UPI0013D8BAA1